MKTSQPPFRKLRGYAFDPSLSQSADTVDLNTIIYQVPWEQLQTDKEGSKKQIGLKGEYVEIIDFDPSINKFYKTVNLNDPYLLAQDGLSPSESNPLFHQQMVYAVVMTTIKNFEQALGRKVTWSPRRKSGSQEREYVPRLRIYPHALREANAYYSPNKKSLLFGYFSATPSDDSLHMPDSLVYTCLSHDIIAHETTHAIIDGMHIHYNTPSNPDVLAFHEAFADLVALFQHFTFPEVLKNQIAATRGDLASQNLLGKLAQQFGTAIGNYGSLRDAIGFTDAAGNWHVKQPDVNDYQRETEPHIRGSILVSAIFDAFINIYKSQVVDLLRIASNGTGILPQGELHPDLVNRLASEASKIAKHVLHMCIRALDYCPPVDITFGDFLRAIITADIDMVADDKKNYRLYFIDAFRKRGIYPKGLINLSIDSLRFQYKPPITNEMQDLFQIIATFLREYLKEIMFEPKRELIYEITKKFMGGNYLGLHRRLTEKFNGSIDFEKLTGIMFSHNPQKLGIRESQAYGDGAPSFQVQNLRTISRVGPDNKQINHIIFSITQRSGVIVENGNFKGHYQPDKQSSPPSNGFDFRGGCTLIFDLYTLELQYAISKPLLDLNHLSKGIHLIDYKRAENQNRYQNEAWDNYNEFHEYFGYQLKDSFTEPFAFLHQH